MIERLDQITVSGLVSLMEGDLNVLREEGEDVAEESLATKARNILFEYMEIVDPSGVRSYLLENEELLKAKISLQIFTICSDIISCGFEDEVRKILEELGFNSAKMSTDKLHAVIKSSIAKAKSTIADIEKLSPPVSGEETNVRRHFDSQTAALMAHFRFQINPDEMKASLYAHLIERYSREVKAYLAATVRR